MSRIPKRPRALAITTLTAALLLTAIPADMVAASPIEPTAATLAGPGMVAGAQIAGAVGTAGHAIQASTPAPQPAAKVSAAAVVVAYARSHLRARYQSSAIGPKSFDCSGLMWRVFREAGLDSKVASQSARSIYLSYRARGLASRTDPQVGDLVVWGNGSHIGVYVGGGNAISALVTGVRVHRVRAMLSPFTAYLHTRLASLVKPAWELQVASHMRTLRHATRTVYLRAQASGASANVGTLRSGSRFVVLGKRYDGAGRLWLRAMTLTGRVGWVPARASTR
ncbi:MAG: NlpC/P60 family protein [Chloroflexota bacterium]